MRFAWLWAKQNIGASIRLAGSEFACYPVSAYVYIDQPGLSDPPDTLEETPAVPATPDRQT
jgi:hypothetical protein